MLTYFRKLAPLAFAATLLVSSCTETKTSTEEKKEIDVMDSTAKKVDETVGQLEDQTKKVEEAIDKLDKEFEENK